MLSFFDFLEEDDEGIFFILVGCIREVYERDFYYEFMVDKKLSVLWIVLEMIVEGKVLFVYIFILFVKVNRCEVDCVVVIECMGWLIGVFEWII